MDVSIDRTRALSTDGKGYVIAPQIGWPLFQATKYTLAVLGWLALVAYILLVAAVYLSLAEAVWRVSLEFFRRLLARADDAMVETDSKSSLLGHLDALDRPATLGK